MICPRCGSRDVNSTNDWEKGIYDAECQSCGHQWEGQYDPEYKNIGMKPTKGVN